MTVHADQDLSDHIGLTKMLCPEKSSFYCTKMRYRENTGSRKNHLPYFIKWVICISNMYNIVCKMLHKLVNKSSLENHSKSQFSDQIKDSDFIWMLVLAFIYLGLQRMWYRSWSKGIEVQKLHLLPNSDNLLSKYCICCQKRKFLAKCYKSVLAKK